MPTLSWVGKNKVVNHHHDVPFRLLDKQYSFTAQDGAPVNSTNNRIIHGDNLESLKSLLPEFEGKINCIYIDPPYNTLKEGFTYSDALVDKNDTFRHSKWCSFMSQRLKIAKNLMAKSSAIFISIDDNEVGALRMLCDEIFGHQNFVANVIWEKKFSPQNDAKWLSDSHDHILVYAKNKETEHPTNRAETQSLHCNLCCPRCMCIE